MFLQEFGDHPNIVKLHNVLKAENDKDIYLVFEFMGKCRCFYFTDSQQNSTSVVVTMYVQ